MKIAVTGATGQLGTLVIHQLLKTIIPSNIIALVRDPKKAKDYQQKGIEVRHFDYDDPKTLVPALHQVDRLLLISSNAIGRRILQHQAVIESAVQAHVPYIAYTSILNAPHNPLILAKEHRETEALIEKSGLDYTLLRNNWYNENYLANTPKNGILYGCALDGKISSASRQDFAEASAQVLAALNHNHKIYELAGSKAYTLADLAHYQNAHYQNISPEEYLHMLIQAGLPQAFAEILVDADIQASQGAMFSQSKDLEMLIGRKTTSIQSQLL